MPSCDGCSSVRVSKLPCVFDWLFICRYFRGREFLFVMNTQYVHAVDRSNNFILRLLATGVSIVAIMSSTQQNRVDFEMNQDYEDHQGNSEKK